MKTNNFFRRISVVSIVAVMATVAGFMAGCGKEENKPLDDAIINSSELEEYIIAGADLKQSLAVFEKEMGRVDFSKLEVTHYTDGRKVMRLPASVGAVNIEEKVLAFNGKKEALLVKHPQFTSCSPERIQAYFQQCIQNSQTVSGRLLKMGINFSRPVLKSGTFEDYGYGQCELYNFLHSWAMNPNYVEVIIIRYTDGTWATYIDTSNTPFRSNIALTRIYNPNTGETVGWKYNGKQISDFGHTHGAGVSGPNPSSGDAAKPGMNNFIYHNHSFHYYH